MKKGMFKIGILLILTAFNSFAQENSDTAFKYYFNQLDGLKDKSDLIITKTKTDSICEFNVVGTVVYVREIGKDSVEYVPSFAYLTMFNKTDTVETSLSENFKIKLSEGKYQIDISRVGTGFITKTIRIKKNVLYTFFVKLKTRRMIQDIEYNCKEKLSKKEIKAIKRHYKNPEKYPLIKTNCGCEISMIIYG